MKELVFIIVLIEIVCFNPILARPDLLKQQKYEFQEYHSSLSYDHISSENARLDVVPVPVQHELSFWSHPHQNEVNAFAEMLRQKYNQMIEQYNKMMQMHHHTLTIQFLPVTYELYHITDDVVWRSYFGKKQKYFDHQAEQMSRQLIRSLEQGLVLPHDLMNPNFFISQAASELNRMYQVQNDIFTNNQQVSSNFDGTFQQRQIDIIKDHTQQQQHILAESTHHETTINSDPNLIYNQETGEFEYLTVATAPDLSSTEKLKGDMISNSNQQHPSHQGITHVGINNEILSKLSQVEKKVIHAPKVNVSGHMQLETKGDEFYGSTYDQQPIYDLRLIESVLSTARPSMVNVISLVRKKTDAKILTTTMKPSTTTVTTTQHPITESSIMSMLPNKKQSYNYKDLYLQVQAELDRLTDLQISDNKSQETHFMGMTSNTDHVKLSYATIVDVTDHNQMRGDQPSNTDDYIIEEYGEFEPGVGYYYMTTERVATTMPVDQPLTPSHFASTTIENSSTTIGLQNKILAAPWDPHSTVNVKSPNPYYSAPLAPFPDNIFQVPRLAAQTQIEHSKTPAVSLNIIDINHPNGSNAAEEDTVSDFDEQQYDSNLENSYTEKYDNVQQRYFDIAGGHYEEGQMYEKQLNYGKSFHNENSQHSDGGLSLNTDSTPHMIDATETPTSLSSKTLMKNWFERQFSKLKKVF